MLLLSGVQDQDLQGGVKLRLVQLQMPQDGKDGENSRVVVTHDGSTSRRHDVVSLQHQVVQRLLWTDIMVKSESILIN